MAKGLVVATALGTELENYSGAIAATECAAAVCHAVFKTAFQISTAGFLQPAEVSYSFSSREIKMVLDGGKYVTMEILLQQGIDIQLATQLVLQQLVFPAFQQQASVAE